MTDYSAALELARNLYRAEGHLRQNHECRKIGDLIGMSSIGAWHAYQRGDLGVPSPKAEPARHGDWRTVCCGIQAVPSLRRYSSSAGRRRMFRLRMCEEGRG